MQKWHKISQKVKQTLPNKISYARLRRIKLDLDEWSEYNTYLAEREKENNHDCKTKYIRIKNKDDSFRYAL